MTRILILGGGGMLGHKMFQTLGRRFPKTRCTLRGSGADQPFARTGLFSGSNVISDVDAIDFDALHALLVDEKPDVIVNCIGVIKQRDTAKVALPSIKINALLPHQLAEWANEWKGRVIHFSTDCVFDGKKGSTYREDDLSTAEDLYGKTKFLGEVATDNALTLRTSIIGRELYNFASLLEWFLAQEGKTIRGFKKVIYSGLTTNHLSEIVATLIADHPRLSGLYQVASEPITKYDLLCLVREVFGTNVEILEEVDTISDRSLDGERFAKDTGIEVRSWRAMIEQLRDDETPYADWR